MITDFTARLESLCRQRGVRASLVVSEYDGMVVDANLRFGQDGDRVGALAASMYRKAIQMNPRPRAMSEMKQARARTTAVIQSTGRESRRTTFMPKMMPPIVEPLCFQRMAP